MVALGAWIAAALVLAPLFAFELTYRWAVRDLHFEPPQDRVPEIFARALWVESGEALGGGATRVMLPDALDLLWHCEYEWPGYSAADALVQTKIKGYGWKQFFASVWLLRHSSEDELSRLLTSNTYFGHGAYGVEAGALAYFGKHADELTLAQSALLAAHVREPGARDCIHFGRTGERDRVVEQLRRARIITAEEASAAIAEPTVLLT